MYFRRVLRHVSKKMLATSIMRADVVVPRMMVHSMGPCVRPSRIVGFRGFSTMEVMVPSMGDSISEGTVVEWLKSPGDFVEEDEVIVVLETDKVSVDVRSTVSGTLQEQLALVDDTVLVGAALAKIEPGEGKATPAAASSSSQPPASTGTEEPVTVVVPSMGDSISEGTVTEFLKSPGDEVDVDEVIIVLETDKVSVDVRSSTAGKLEKLLVNMDDVVEIGAPLAIIQPGPISKSAASPTPSPQPTKVATPVPPPVSTPIATPASPPVEPTSTPVASPTGLSGRGETREKMSRMRMRIAERLKESQNVAASLTTFQDCDMGNLMEMRKTYKDEFEKKHGTKLGFMSAFVKASTEALLEIPSVNGYIDDATNEIVYKDYVDMSVAVATPKGLVTPVLQNTHQMTFADIEKNLALLAERARSGDLALEEMMGGNFTISNGGVFGSLMGTPILNRPQSAILGMHATKMRPVVYDGAIVARPMMYLALTYDHRIIDGREAVTFLKSVANKIENPERLLLQL